MRVFPDPNTPSLWDDAYITINEPGAAHDGTTMLADARTGGTPGPTEYANIKSSIVISTSIDGVIPAGNTPVAAWLYLAQKGWTGEDNQYLRVREITTPVWRETNATWLEPWFNPGAYGPNDVQPYTAQVVVTPQTTVTPAYVRFDLLPIILKGVTTLKVKLEPNCTPSASSGTCRTSSEWYAKENGNWQPFIELSFAGGDTPTPTSTPVQPTAMPTATPTFTGVAPTATNTPAATRTATPTPVPALKVNEISANPGADWSGDGIVSERDRWVEVCNWTASTIDYQSDYWLTFNGKPSDLFTGEIRSGECDIFWYELSGEQFKPLITGGTVKLYGPSGLVDTVTYSAQAYGMAWARLPDGSATWIQQRPSPGESNYFWAWGHHPTPTVTPTPTATP